MTEETMSRTLAGALYAAASQNPDGEALIYVDTGETWTFQGLATRVEQQLAAFRAAGLRKGDRLLIMLDNTPDFVFTWMACGLGGIVQVPVNTEYKGEMLRYVVEHSGARTMVVNSAYAGRLTDVISHDAKLATCLLTDPLHESSLPLEVVQLETLLADVTGEPQAESVAEWDQMAIMYTSGTTGPAKGGVITHRHAFTYAETAATVLDLQAGDRYYAPLPLFHIGGQWAVGFAALQRKATCILKHRFSVSEYWDDCARHNVTASFLLGAMAHWVFGQEPSADDAANSVEKMIMVPLLDDVEGFKKRFGLEVSTCYASTEANVPLASTFATTTSNSCGRAVEGFELRVADEFDNEVDTGEVGELLIRTDEPWTTLVEYLNNPAATSLALRNQWLHTGDAFRRDADGNYYFVDRIKDAIRRRGENISSFEVEREVYRFDDVLECAAVGVPSEYTENDLVIVVVPKAGRTIDVSSLRAFLTERMPKFMVPDRIEIVEMLPKTPTGKLQKFALREKFAVTT